MACRGTSPLANIRLIVANIRSIATNIRPITVKIRPITTFPSQPCLMKLSGALKQLGDDSSKRPAGVLLPAKRVSVTAKRRFTTKRVRFPIKKV